MREDATRSSLVHCVEVGYCIEGVTGLLLFVVWMTRRVERDPGGRRAGGVGLDTGGDLRELTLFGVNGKGDDTTVVTRCEECHAACAVIGGFVRSGKGGLAEAEP